MITRFIYPLWLREMISWHTRFLFKNINDKDVSLAFNQTIRLDLKKQDIAHRSIIVNGFFERKITQRFLKLADRGGLMVDVGANYGYYSCLWAAQKETNLVVAFEASPLNVAPLQNNISKNKLWQSIFINPVALGKEVGQLMFTLETDQQQTGWGGFTIDDSKDAIEVPVITLDEYARKNDIHQIDVLKIDTEGADTWVLYGAKQLLEQKRIKHIFFEHNPDRIKLLHIDSDEAHGFLKRLGYAIEQLSPNDFYASLP